MKFKIATVDHAQGVFINTKASFRTRHGARVDYYFNTDHSTLSLGLSEGYCLMEEDIDDLIDFLKFAKEQLK